MRKLNVACTPVRRGAPWPSNYSYLKGASSMSTLTALAEADLVSPHGGPLVDRIVPLAEAEALRRRAALLPSLTLDPRELADLELIATGAASPLTGFLGAADYLSVLAHLRLENGTVWPLPLTLAVDEPTGKSVKPGDAAALRDSNGRLWGVIDVTEVFERDPLLEARKVYRTEDPSHPGVAYLLARPRWLVAGPVAVLPLPEDLPFAGSSPSAAGVGSRASRRATPSTAPTST
jgi:sulfate adenylyltransferase